MLDICIDFETRSRADLSSTNAYKYSAHPSTEVLCMGWGPLTGEYVQLWMPGEPFPFASLWPDTFAGFPLEDWPVRFWASNAEFEGNIWGHVCAPRYGWPTLPISRLNCIQAAASYAGLPRKHELVCKALGFADKGKDEEGHRNMLNLCKPKIGNENAELVGCEWTGGEFDE